MLIKEYRICLPMSVDEYRIAQLYMIQKKSREESSGEGSGVEILVNEPYSGGPGGSGQYTHKIYHVGSHLPGWFRAVLPKTALMVEEQAWNAYPYTKTIYKCPFIEKLHLEIETCYKNDNGEQENVFDLSGSELRDRSVDYIDIVRDTVSGGDYQAEEDPTVFVSTKTGRGPLDENWRQEHAVAMRDNPGQSQKVIMCAYKLCKVEFKYWGMQSKIERFIQDVGLRKTMVRAHRQAWCWQDEYYGLTIEDIRKLEHETAQALARKMAIAKGEEPPPEENGDTTTGTSAAAESSKEQGKRVSISTGSSQHAGSGSGAGSNTARGRAGSGGAPARKGSWGSVPKHRSSGSGRNLNENEWQNVESLEQLRQDSSDDDTFYDAKDDLYTSTMSLNPSLLRSSSMELLPQDVADGTYKAAPAAADAGRDLGASAGGSTVADHLRQFSGGSSSVDYSLPPSPGVTSSTCKTTILFLVLHGGSIVEMSDTDHTSVMKRSDLTTLRSTIDATTSAHYPAIYNHIATRLVKCENICSQVVSLLSSLSPFSYESASLAALPASAVSLFVSGSPDYTRTVSAVVDKANQVYHEFLLSEEGKGFNGQVCLIGDSVGSLLGYDALCKNNPFLTSHNNTQLYESVTENGETEAQVSTSNPDITSEADSSLSVTPQMNLSASCGHGSMPSPKRLINPRAVQNFMRSPSCPAQRGGSDSDSDPPNTPREYQNRFDFDVTDFFMLGSPLAVVLAYRKACYLTPGASNDLLPRPCCHQVYNLFYPSDPSATRLEPLLCHDFHVIPPTKVPRYQKFPLGDGQAIHVVETIQSNSQIFTSAASSAGGSASGVDVARRPSNMSVLSQVSGQHDLNVANITAVTSRWWGMKRLDYALYCPDALQSFPSSALPYLLHASFWESNDVVAFILRQVIRQELHSVASEGYREVGVFKQTKPREKWLKRRTTIKVKNSTPNHRANDVIVLEDKPQLLCARFTYGPLDMVSLTGEKVDVHIMSNTETGDWKYLGTDVTDNNGRLAYTIPKDKQLTQGMYPVKMVVRGDHTSTDFYMSVLPPNTECIVFSIDGSFTASVSILGKDPKVKPGAVDVVRHWQELGYLIIYITARPDMQQNKVVAWLAQHNFPHGMVIFMDGVSTDPMRQKANYLRQRIQEAKICIQGAYGSSKDISVYQSLGLQSHQIFINGKLSKKMQKEAVMIADGYATHLVELSGHSVSRPAVGNARLFLRKNCFSLPGQGKHGGGAGGQGSGSKRNTVRKTLSLPQRSTRGHTAAGRESSPALFARQESNRRSPQPHTYRLDSSDI